MKILFVRPRKINPVSFMLLILLLLLQSIVLVHAAENDAALVLLPEGYFQEQQSGRMWQFDRSKKLETSEEVAHYLESINNGPYNDWRLPTKQELYDLFSIFDLKRNGEVKIRLEGDYWLSEKDKQNMYIGSWQIGDGCGPSRTFYSGKRGYVRAVRP
ncbi:MAG: hypothetical protein ACWGOX_08865 [Desulforhopalus sp.]